jgi:ComF family protein
VDFKFHEQPAWARSFAMLMRAAPWIEPALDCADMLIPMPISRERLRERGFNQTLLIARQLARDKVTNDVLLRVRDAPAQSTLPRKERLHNVANAFAVDPLRVDALRGKRVVLLDDVMTSGASLHSAATALKKAGVGHLCTMVFARTQHSDEGLRQ